MNNPNYRNAYMASLNQQVKLNQIVYKANVGNPSFTQFTQNNGGRGQYIGNIPTSKK